MGTEFDYDLNIFQKEQRYEDPETGEEWYDYAGPWYIDVYEVNPPGHQHVAGPLELSFVESTMLGLGQKDSYFDYPDSWYGLTGFLEDYREQLHPRIITYLESFPKYKEEVLF